MTGGVQLATTICGGGLCSHGQRGDDAIPELARLLTAELATAKPPTFTEETSVETDPAESSVTRRVNRRAEHRKLNDFK